MAFPRKYINEQDIINAQKRDEHLKQERQDIINSGKYRQISNFNIGDIVLIRNFTKKSKYDPFFQCDPLTIIKVNDHGRCLTLMRISDEQL